VEVGGKIGSFRFSVCHVVVIWYLLLERLFEHIQWKMFVLGHVLVLVK
jgi:hypothetical protein